MKKILALVLQIIIVLIGIVALILLLWEPHLEGVNANATTLYEIYFDDPFLAYIYTASITFFVGLYQMFKLAGFMGRNELFSAYSAKALRAIQYCAMILIAFILGAEAWIIIFQSGKDDIAGGVAVGLGIIIISIIVAIAAVLFERMVRTISRNKV